MSLENGSLKEPSISFPAPEDIKYSNSYWQSLEGQFPSQGTFHFFNAYYDNRTLNKFKPSVRLMSMINRNKTENIWCHFWFPKGDIINPISSNNSDRIFVWLYNI